MILDSLLSVLQTNALLTAFAFVGILVWLSYQISARLTRGHVHGSAIAIMIGLVLAYTGGRMTGGNQGIADLSLLTGVGIMGGAMFRDFAIVATAFGDHRLRAVVEIDDRHSSMKQRHFHRMRSVRRVNRDAIVKSAVTIGPAVGNAVIDAVEPVLGNCSAVRAQNAADAAHGAKRSRIADHSSFS